MTDPFLIGSSLGRASIRLAQGAIALVLPARVLAGPFRGLEFCKNTFGSALLPKILGTYEKEIASYLHEAVVNPTTDVFLDIGCAGGFYLQVVSQLRSDIDLIGIDASDRATKLARRRVSNQRRLTILNRRARSEDIVDVCARYRRPVILVDIEGGERELLSEGLAEHARNAVFVIEVHEFVGASASAVAAMLSGTHSVTAIPFGYYDLAPRAVSALDSPLKLFLRHELRHPRTCYLVAIPRR